MAAMEHCFGALSANPCRACRDLSWEKIRIRIRQDKKIPNSFPTGGRDIAHDDNYSGEIDAPQTVVDDVANDVQLAALVEHLSMSEPADCGRRQMAKDPFDERWCTRCFVAFPSKWARLQHVKICKLHHVCRWCQGPTDYATRQDLQAHRCGERVSCRLCGSPNSWPDRAALDRHKMRDHFVCRACEMDCNFLSEEVLKKHKRIMHIAVYCGFCNLLFVNETGKSEHMDSEHRKCTSCQEFCEHEASRSEHRAKYCHFCRVEFQSSDSKAAHLKITHANACEDCAFNPTSNCKFCAKHQAEEDQRMAYGTWFMLLWSVISIIRSIARTRSETQNHQQKQTDGSQTSSKPPLPPLPEGMVDLYAVLKVSRSSTVEEIKTAAKTRRIEMHPDRLERQKGLSDDRKEMIREEAKQVGWAADILTDPHGREEYERELWATALRAQETDAFR